MTETERISEQVTRAAQEVEIWRRRARRSLYALFAVCGALVALGGAVVYDASQTAKQDARTLQIAQVASCERSNNLRKILNNRIRTSLRERRAFQDAGLYEEFFPAVSPERIESLVKEQQKQEREQLRELRQVDCLKEHPPPNGSS